jgi:hypothetical protein
MTHFSNSGLPSKLNSGLPSKLNILTMRGCLRRVKRAAAPRRPKPRSLKTHSPRRFYRQNNQRLAPTATLLCACAVGISPCILHHFVAFVASLHLSLVSNLTIAPGVTRATRRQTCTALRPQPTHATPLPCTRQHWVGDTQRSGGVAACRPRSPRHKRTPLKPAVCFKIDSL